MPENDNNQLISSQSNGDETSELSLSKKKNNKTIKLIAYPMAILFAVFIVLIIGAVIWYKSELNPISSDKNQKIIVNIATGSSPNQIGQLLKEKSIIRSSLAFEIYLRLLGKSNNLQAGVYELSPADTVPKIVDYFIKGEVIRDNIMFYPGATLVDNTDKKLSSKLDVTTVLLNAGYTHEQIAEALTKTYESPLFDSKPENTSLEGYIYGDTYSFSSGVSVDDIFKRVFQVFNSVVQDNNLVERFSSHGLNLYQGITLASIVQREAGSDDEKYQIAQVFYNRLNQGMALGSDVTYQYIADKTGVARDPDMDSPYNTRRFVGLPPGPISVPDLESLLAVANPAKGDYMYFLSGDDDITYFAYTMYEHQQNIIKHCKIKCSSL